MNFLQNFELNNLLYSLSVLSKHMLFYVNTQEKYLMKISQYETEST